MKKVIYGIIALLGIGLISTNFIVDQNNIDHKQALASGTICKWITDTGYDGIGPLYYKAPEGDYWVESNNSNYSIAPSYLNIFQNHLSLVGCSSSNDGSTLTYGLVYDEDLKTPLTKKLYFGEGNSSYMINTSTPYVELKDGYVVAEYTCWSWTPTSAGYYSKCASWRKYTDSKKPVVIKPVYSLPMVLTTPSTYTCICAEY